MVKFLTATTSFVVPASLLLLCWCCKHHDQGTVRVGLLFQEDGCGTAWRAASTQAKSLHLQKQAWSGRGNRSGMRPFKSLSLLPLMYFLWQDWTTQTSPLGNKSVEPKPTVEVSHLHTYNTTTFPLSHCFVTSDARPGFLYLKCILLLCLLRSLNHAETTPYP